MNDQTNTAPVFHVPVLMNEVLQNLQPEKCKIIVDGTLGHGGHAEALLNAASKTSQLIGIDRDPRNVAIAKERLSVFEGRVRIFQNSYANIVDVLAEAKVEKVDAILLDVGFSSAHIDDPTRGFSFLHEGPLDMRYDPTTGETAADIVNTETEEMLAEIFRVYGEEPFSKKIAAALVEARQEKHFETTTELAEAVLKVVKRHGRVHPATRIFQALRIAVNDELAALKSVIPVALEKLSVGGRLAIISFHSLEDRLVKTAFKEAGIKPEYSLITKRPIKPSEKEVKLNSRSRSAKLRVIERIT